MIAALDSSVDRPSAAVATAARAAGVGLWSGYLSTRPGVGLLSSWSRADFDAARQAGGTPLAFCSGWDDPAALRSLAGAWQVRLCLDVEPGIRDLGPWTQAWLDAAGAGLYGRAAVHGLSAAFHVLAAYPGFDPGASWSRVLPRPPGPVGWQWQGSHQEFGVTVDRGWYDDWFGAVTAPRRSATMALIDPGIPEQPDRLDTVYAGPDGHAYWGAFPGGAGDWQGFSGRLTDLGAPPSGSGFVHAEGVVKPYQGVYRLHVWAVTAGGVPWLRVMNAVTFAEVPGTGGWTAFRGGPDVAVPAADSVALTRMASALRDAAAELEQ